MPFQPRVSAKQAAVINDPSRYILVSGPRLSSKSYGVMHRLAWRMWNIPNYVGCIVGKTTSASADSGIWSLLTETIIPEWIAGKFGFKWDTEPRSQGITHKLYFTIRNRVGGISKMFLDSLDVEDDVEDKFKGRFFTEIVLSEASNFRNRSTFDCLTECLRTPGVPQSDHAIVLDTNPAVEGQEHFIYRLFWHFRSLDLENLTDETRKDLNLNMVDDEALPDVITSLRELQSQLSLHLFKVPDNQFITLAQQRAQFAKYCHSATLLARYVYGDWVADSGEGIFGEVWRPEIHVIGERANALNPDPEKMIPETECIELMGGWDIGRRNTAVVLMEPVPVQVIEYGEQVTRTGFKILDSYVSLGKQQKIWEIAEIIEEKIHYWNSLCKNPPQWLHVSDSSSFDVNGNESTEAQDLYALTNGLIELKSVVMSSARHSQGLQIKGRGGINRGIDLLQRMLFENRIWVNAATCQDIMEMFSTIRKKKDGELAMNHPMKHAMDACRYPISFKCWSEMRRNSPQNHTTKDASKILVTAL